jgi:hypothetical protein
VAAKGQASPCKKTDVPVAPEKKVTLKKVANDAATILSKRVKCLLCYHNIRDFKPSGDVKFIPNHLLLLNK